MFKSKEEERERVSEICWSSRTLDVEMREGSTREGASLEFRFSWSDEILSCTRILFSMGSFETRSSAFVSGNVCVLARSAAIRLCPFIVDNPG